MDDEFADPNGLDDSELDLVQALKDPTKAKRKRPTPSREEGLEQKRRPGRQETHKELNAFIKDEVLKLDIAKQIPHPDQYPLWQQSNDPLKDVSLETYKQ